MPYGKSLHERTLCYFGFHDITFDLEEDAVLCRKCDNVVGRVQTVLRPPRGYVRSPRTDDAPGSEIAHLCAAMLSSYIAGLRQAIASGRGDERAGRDVALFGELVDRYDRAVR